MNIAEARSFNDGMEFYDHKNNTSIRLTRDSNGDIVIEKQNITKQLKKVKNGPLKTIAMFAISILFTFIFNYCHNYKIEIIAILLFIWIVTFGYYFINSKNPNNFMSFKYHAAEHKVLNYMDKFGKATQDCFEIMKMSSISIRCGSTIIAVTYVLISLLTIGILFMPWLILKILWCITSLFITLYLWGKGKCNFFQKLVLKDPEYAEIELATKGLWEYMKMKE